MSSNPVGSASAAAPKKKKYVLAVGPRLRKLLYLIFVLVAILFANSGYLATITFLEWFSGETYQDFFYQRMFLIHLAVGLLLILPLIIFGFAHMWVSKNRRNRRAIRIGYALLVISLIVLATGILLMRVSGFDLKEPMTRSTVYWLHVACPLAAVWLYWLHRLAGPRIKWRVGFTFAGISLAMIVVMVGLQLQDPRKWNAVGPDSGVQYFEPSLARTSSGNFIPASALMNDQYCLKCHADVHKAWSESVHRFSSFNNPPYLASVSQTREVSLKRDGSVQASRWCAGCHDPVPFFSGAFDDPKFELLTHPTAKAGITCTVCHAITHVNSVRGNADYTIEEPLHYPFAFSENPALQWINNQLVKAKPSFHKKTFLKPLHTSAEFCSTCHKVHLPKALNDYKEFLRGQNHYDPYLLSGVSGHGARSFYYPPKAVDNCNKCHMPLVASNDFGAKFFDDAKELSVHDHLFPSANTGIAWLRDKDLIIKAHQDFLKDTVRVDIFGIHQEAEIDSPLTAPLRPAVPTLQPGKTYLLDTVIRTLKLGHLFTQGTVDSNEVWLDVKVTSGNRVIGRSGGVDPSRNNEVDPWSHFVNVFMLDKDGNRIDRRNAQDIFTPLYNHQIPPGAGQTVHYELRIPEDVTEPVTVELKLQYRKFDQRYMDFVAKQNEAIGQIIRGHEAGTDYVNRLPITTMASDSITFPIEGVETSVENPERNIPVWQRWNDYGIGLLLKGKAELRQAELAFTEVEKLKRWDGPLNLARVFNTEGRLDEAVDALERAKTYEQEEGFPRWTWAWLSGVVNAQQGYLEDAEKNLRSVLEDSTPDMQKRGFDFSLDIEVINELGKTLFDLGNMRKRQLLPEESEQYFRDAVTQFKSTLLIDPENVSAHYNLQLLYEALNDEVINELGKNLVDLGNMLTQQQRSKEEVEQYLRDAVTQFESTLLIDPENVAAQHNLQLLQKALEYQDLAQKHQQLHERYKADDNAQGRAIRLAREKYPAANQAAEAVVKYSLFREGAPELNTTATVAEVEKETADVK